MLQLTYKDVLQQKSTTRLYPDVRLSENKGRIITFLCCHPSLLYNVHLWRKTSTMMSRTN